MKHTGSFYMEYSDRKAPAMIRAFVVIMVAGILSSCANMQQSGPGTSQPSANAGRQAESQQPAATAAPAAQASTAGGNAQEEEDSGINREGRVIQLGRFVEERPVVEVPEGTTVELNYEQEDLRAVFEQLLYGSSS